MSTGGNGQAWILSRLIERNMSVGSLAGELGLTEIEFLSKITGRAPLLSKEADLMSKSLGISRKKLKKALMRKNSDGGMNCEALATGCGDGRIMSDSGYPAEKRQHASLQWSSSSDVRNCGETKRNKLSGGIGEMFSNMVLGGELSQLSEDVDDKETLIVDVELSVKTRFIGKRTDKLSSGVEAQLSQIWKKIRDKFSFI